MNTAGALGVLGLGLIGSKLTRKSFGSNYLKGKVALVTGGTKGLGYILSRQLIEEGCRVAICARDQEELAQAKSNLQRYGGDVLTQVCDVADEEQVKTLIDDVIEHFGQLDIVINNAGIIQVGPMEAFSRKDYDNAMNVMYWGIANTTFNVIPYMKRRKQGHIVNVTSVGGKVSVPHLLPYDASKFAAVGFSEGSAAELRKDGIYVTTIVPGLMRTGSYVNALFQKGNQREFNLFSFMSSAPFLTLNAEKAASRIITAIKEKRAFKVIGIQTRALIELHHFFPNLTVRMFGLVSKLLPKSNEKELSKGEGFEAPGGSSESHGFKKLGKKAQEKYQSHEKH